MNTGVQLNFCNIYRIIKICLENYPATKSYADIGEKKKDKFLPLTMKNWLNGKNRNEMCVKHFKTYKWFKYLFIVSKKKKPWAKHFMFNIMPHTWMMDILYFPYLQLFQIYLVKIYNLFRFFLDINNISDIEFGSRNRCVPIWNF